MEPMEKRVMLLEARGRLSGSELCWMLNSLRRGKSIAAFRQTPDLWGEEAAVMVRGGI